MKKNIDEYTKDNCGPFWHEHLAWLHKMRAYWAWDTKQEVGGEEFDHRMVNLLSQYVQETGQVNAHWGLTSSDIEDNLWLSFVSETLDEWVNRMSFLQENLRVLSGRCWKIKVDGYTHLQRAEPVEFARRLEYYGDQLSLLKADRPRIFGKPFSGPTGSLRTEMEMLGYNYELDRFAWSRFNLRAPRSSLAIQSADGMGFVEGAQYLVRVSALLHKIAADFRMMHAFGQVEVPPKMAGSSSMAYKTNPVELEKVCSKCRKLMYLDQGLVHGLAHNYLERTLDTSWLIRNTWNEFAELSTLPRELGQAIVRIRLVAPEAEESPENRELLLSPTKGGRWPTYVAQLEAKNRVTETGENNE